ncbi:MAG: putative FAD-dependent oxygenase, partial [Actinomycetia bacterium]|nr:putative FAD-dependent oxygenase [Actinomycetes bacterium]
MDDLSRRHLFKAATVAGAGAVILPGITAAGTLGTAASDSGSAASTSAPSTISDSMKSPPAKLTGRIVRPQDPDYASASLGWDELFVRYPLVIVFAQETQDVVNALTWARQNDVALRVRSGRHSLEGWSNVDNGIVIDISELKSVKINTASRIATVGAGLSQLEAVTTLAKKD